MLTTGAFTQDSKNETEGIKGESQLRPSFSQEFSVAVVSSAKVAPMPQCKPLISKYTFTFKLVRESTKVKVTISDDVMRNSALCVPCQLKS